MSAHAMAPTLVERRKPPHKVPPRDYGWTLFLCLLALALAGGFPLARDGLYHSGDHIGYNLGLVGGLMMLTLLLYPLRKRAHFMRKWGLMPHWFEWHMACGVLGPALILFHSTFHIGSFNAGVALVAMLIVAGSGVFGRFFYTKVHWGLYGRQMSFQQLQSELDGHGDVKSVLSFAPAIHGKLDEFRDYAMRAKGGALGARHFLALNLRAHMLGRELERELEDVMYTDALPRHWNAAQMKLLDQLFHENRAFMHSYLKAVRDLALFRTYEKLFSLWAFLHVPPVVVLTFAAIWHVWSVTMY